MTTPAHLDLEVYRDEDLTKRSPDLPVVYLYRGVHPQRPVDEEVHGRTFVVLVDVTEAGKAAELETSKDFDIPLGREADMVGLYGLVLLRTGDWLFARDVFGSGNPTDDKLQVIVCEPPSMRQKRDDLRARAQTLLGTPEDREDGQALFEKWPQAKRIRPHDRAYPFGCLVQQPNLVEAPAAAFKLPEEESPQEHQAEIRDFLSAGADLCISTWDSVAPASIRDAQRAYGDAINSPRVGSDRNYAFPAWQMNIANERATPNDSLTKDMRFFGSIHTDKHDDVTGFSCMTPLSELTKKDGEEPGRFHFITRGFYVNLQPLVNVFFSGRLPHGGTAPLSPPGQTPPPWALRCVLIAYPAGAIVSGGARHALAALPFREPMYISPEMTGVHSPCVIQSASTGYTNYARDGMAIMQEDSLLRFFVRCLLLLCVFLCQQLPRSLEVAVDRKKFLEAFSAQTNGVRSVAEDWPLGPDGPVHPSSTNHNTASQETPLGDAGSSSGELSPRARAFQAHIKCYEFLAPAIPAVPNLYPGADESDDYDLPFRPKPRPKPKPNNGTRAPKGHNAHQAKAKGQRMGAGRPDWEDALQERGPESPEEESPDTCASGKRPAPPEDELDRAQKRPRTGDYADGSMSPLTNFSDDDNPDLIHPSPSHGAPEDEEFDVNDDEDHLTRAELHFLNGFAVNGIHEYLREVTEVLEHLQQLPFLAVQQALSILHKIDLGVSQEKGLRIRAKEVQVVFSLHSLNAQAVENAVTARTCRRKIMATNFHLSTHLTTSIFDRVLALSARRGLIPPAPPSTKDPDLLLHRLVRVVRDDLSGHVLHFKYDSADLLDTMFDPPTPVIHPARVYTFFDRRYYSGDELNQRTAEVVVAILRHWFELPSDSITAARTTFLGIVLDKLGYAAFLLPTVWEMYLAMPPSMVASLANGRLQRLLDGLPVSNTSTPAFAELHSLGQRHQELASALWEIASTQRSGPTRSLPSNLVDSAFQVDHQMREHPGPLPTTPITPHTQFHNRLPSLMKFLQSAHKVALRLCPGGAVSPLGLTRLEREIISDPDYLLPFRELAPSRTYINRGLQDTSSHANVFAAPAGFFSLIVHRVILFRTPYLASRVIPEVEKRVMFSGPEDFFAHLDHLQQLYPHHIRNKEEFFCNRNALSSQTLNRSIYAASAAWQFANHSMWSDLVGEGLPMSYEAARSTLLKIDSSMEQRVSSFGALTRYLTLADLCSHGVVCLPTKEEMGYTVAALGAGGRDGLSVCGLLPERIKPAKRVRGKGHDKNKGKLPADVGKEKVKDAFVTFYDGVAQGLEGAGLSTDLWNTVVAEHTLCKVLRLKNLI